MYTTMKQILLLIFAVLMAGSVCAQADGNNVILPEGLQWQQIIEGVEFAAAHGDWETGTHHKYVRFAPGVTAPLHVHSSNFKLVVISGGFTHTLSNDETPVAFAPGTYIHGISNQPHINSCISEEPCIVFSVYEGAFDFEFVE
jgi:anti-sigma factor ChrR (cupin superfamily)